MVDDDSKGRKRKSRGRKQKLEANPLVGELAKDPSDVPAEETVIAGYAGKSREAGCWRLYSTPELNEFFEFNEADVVRVDKREDPIGGKTFVWLKPTASLRMTRIETRKMQADFLRGDFTRELMAHAEPWAVVALDVSPREASGTSQWWCTWKILGCTRQMLGCTQRVRGQHRTIDFSCEKVVPECDEPTDTTCPLCSVDCTDVC